MNSKTSSAEKAREKSKCVGSDDLINERLLAVQRFCCATTWGILGECGIDDLWEEFTGRPKPVCAAGVATVPRLAQNKLAALGTVAEVKPIGDSALASLSTGPDGAPSGSSVNTADHDVEFADLRFIVQMLRYRLPAESPEEVQTIHHHDRFEQPDF